MPRTWRCRRWKTCCGGAFTWTTWRRGCGCAATIAQLVEQLETLFDFLPELKGKARIGILAGIDWDAGVEEEAQAAGLYTARIRDEMFELTTPKGFKPRKW